MAMPETHRVHYIIYLHFKHTLYKLITNDLTSLTTTLAPLASKLRTGRIHIYFRGTRHICIHEISNNYWNTFCN